MATTNPKRKTARFYATLGFIVCVGSLIVMQFFIGGTEDPERARSALSSVATAGGGLFLFYFIKLRSMRDDAES